MRGRVLIVAGSDSGGGAGIQADIKTVTALGGYAATAVSALTAQNTLGVQEIMRVPPAFVARQMRSVLDDIGADVIKLGMLPNSDVISAVGDVLAAFPSIPVVLDPVMVASSGAALMMPEARETLKSRLMPSVALLTPNIPEAALLSGRDIRTIDDMVEVGRALSGADGPAVLVKGGHMSGDVLVDVLVEDETVEFFEGQRIQSRATHGTGCSLASAIATGLAQGMAMRDAIERARRYTGGDPDGISHG